MARKPRTIVAIHLLVVSSALSTALLEAAGDQISSEVSSHLSEVIAVLQREWLYREKMDWERFQKRVFDEAGAAQTIPEAYDAIRLALTLLGDKHTYYIPSSGDTIFNPQSPTQSTGGCTPAPISTPDLPADIGYVRIQITPATPKSEIQEALRRRDGPNVVGWIVDLRNSRGGNMWPALAGVGSLLGNGTAGSFVDAAGRGTPWGYQDGRAWLDGQTIEEVDAPYKLASSTSRVAVLTDIGVASSGEAIAIAFRGRPNARSFGSATCGLSTAVRQLPLANRARLAVVVSVMADRRARQYGGMVEPDESIADPTHVVERAVAWLRQR
jgi:hypothetical protein